MIIKIVVATIIVLGQAGLVAATPVQPDPLEVKYTQTLETRAADILHSLVLANPDQSRNVHDLIITHYRILKAWHTTNDASLKSSDTNEVTITRAKLLNIHADFIAQLATQLSPGQIEIVKDKMTYGKVLFTFNGYMAAYPHLGESDQQLILDMLKQAREEAMECGSANEKSAVFKKFKGRINNYLSNHGVHPDKKMVATSTNALPDKN
ncbi:MAG: DUF3826 domain-containing protein [Verrucomicrobiota bacterium]